jgi:hypothetical protein
MLQPIGPIRKFQRKRSLVNRNGIVKEARAFVHDKPLGCSILKHSSLLGPFISYKEKEAF